MTDISSTLASIDAAARCQRLERACREELQSLWHDLYEAINRAIRCTWSIQALGLKDRIQTLTRLVGPADWECIQITLIETGIYEEVHREIDVAVNPDMERIAATRRSIDARRSRPL